MAVDCQWLLMRIWSIAFLMTLFRLGLVLMTEKKNNQEWFCHQPWPIPLLSISSCSAYLISNICFFTFVKTTLKTTRITTVRCLQLLCRRTLELPTNYLLFPLSLIDKLEQRHCFLIFRQPQTKMYISYIFLHCFIGNICQI